MPGFACIASQGGVGDVFSWPITALSPLRISHKTGPGYAVCQYVTAKFERDKVFAEDDDVLVVIDGAILNFRDLRRRLDAPDYFQTVKQLYRTNGDEFFRDFRGEFSGLLYDKSADKWLVFTNHTGMKPVFYHRLKDGFACATDLLVLNRLLRATGWRPSLDVEAAYMLLTYGYMLEDYTLLTDVRKLQPGHYFRWSHGSFAVQPYHVLHNNVWHEETRQNFIERFDQLFREAVIAEYEKDREYGYQHLAHISGGLDCRLNVFVAHELGYDQMLNVTFSQSDYLDEKISKRMATDLGHDFLFYALDSGRCLTTTIEDVVRINGGLVLYSGAAHELSCYRVLNFGPYGGIHSGQVGGHPLTGIWLAAPQLQKPPLHVGITSMYLVDRIRPLIERLQDGYDSKEIFMIKNRGFNATANGNWVGNQFTEMFSPFLHTDLLDYVLTVPPRLKYKSMLYEEWIVRKHPRAAGYPSTRTGLKIGGPRRAGLRAASVPVRSPAMPRRMAHGLHESLRVLVSNPAALAGVYVRVCGEPPGPAERPAGVAVRLPRDVQRTAGGRKNPGHDAAGGRATAFLPCGFGAATTCSSG